MSSGAESLPLCLVANFGSESDDTIVKQVLFKGQKIVDDEGSANDGGGFTWEVDNKYYTCSVRVRVEDGTSDRLSVSPSPMPEALVLYVGWESVGWGGDLTSKLKAVHEMFESGHIKLLVARSFVDDAARLEAQEWAIDKGIEIIDFSEEEGEDLGGEEMEEKFFAVSPQKRVIEALQTSPWPNIRMKKDKEDGRSSMDPDSNLVSSGGICDEDDFESLFTQLSTFRDRSTTLPDEERRAFAEKVAMQFYNAIGGEETSGEEE